MFGKKANVVVFDEAKTFFFKFFLIFFIFLEKKKKKKCCCFFCFWGQCLRLLRSATTPSALPRPLRTADSATPTRLVAKPSLQNAEKTASWLSPATSSSSLSEDALVRFVFFVFFLFFVLFFLTFFFFSEAECLSKSFLMCGLGAQFKECRARYQRHCRNVCLAKPVEVRKFLKSAHCNRPMCYAQSFLKCGRGSKNRVCRRTFLVDCMRNCNPNSNSTAPPVILGCNHHDCKLRSEAKCGLLPSADHCRGAEYTACRGDQSRCAAHSFIICGVGPKYQTCRKNFVATCRQQCVVHNETIAPTTTTTAPVTTVAEPCNEDVCQQRALAFCGVGRVHCNTEHFHYCLLGCASAATTTTTTPAPVTSSMLTAAPGPTTTMTPCSLEACKAAAALVCGNLLSGARCRRVELARCAEHCNGFIGGSLPSAVPPTLCDLLKAKRRRCRTRACRIRISRAIRTCGPASPEVCDRLRQRAQRCKKRLCMRLVMRVIVRRCPAVVATTTQPGINPFTDRVQTRRNGFTLNGAVNPFTDARGVYAAMATLSAARTTTTTVAPCSREACMEAAFMVCGRLPSGKACRTREVTDCVKHCQPATTAGPTTTLSLYVPPPSTAAPTTTTEAQTVFFTSGPPGPATGEPTFDLFRTTMAPVTRPPGACDQNMLFHQYTDCRSEVCRDGVRAAMKVCESHNHGGLMSRQKQLQLQLNACQTADCKVKVRKSLNRVKNTLAKQTIATERLNYRTEQSGLKALRATLRRCKSEACKKRESTELVAAMERIVVSKSKIDSLRVLRFALQAEARTIKNLEELVSLREARIECVTKRCYGRVARKAQRAKWRLTASRRHYALEKRLYKVTQRMLKRVEQQARATVELSRCTTRNCRRDTRHTLRQLTRKIDRLHRSLERRARKTHLLRHNAARLASARVFHRLRQKLIVKRAGCTSSKCTRMFTRRIDLYARIIARILASKAAARKPFKSSVSEIDHRHIAKAKASHREKDDRAEEEMEELASRIGFLKAPPCVRHLADLNEKLAAALTAKNDKEADRLEGVIDKINCEAAGDLPDEEKIHKTEVVEASTTGQVTSTITSTEKPTPKPVPCEEQLAALHTAYANALSTNNATAAKTARLQMSELPCGDESSDDDDDFAAQTTTTKVATQVPIEASCAGKMASLHAQLAAALTAGNSEQIRVVRKQLKQTKRECRKSLRDACQAEIDAVETKRADLNLELTALFNQAARCSSAACTEHLEREIGSVKRTLARLRTPSC